MEQIRVAKDGKKMQYIPGGKYVMGSEQGYHEEKPLHEVEVAPFYMDETLVTNAEFKAYCDAIGRGYPGSPRWADMPNYFLDYPDYPVINVSWGEVYLYPSFCALSRQENSLFLSAKLTLLPQGASSPQGYLGAFRPPAAAYSHSCSVGRRLPAHLA